jgi:insulin receptor
MMSKIDFYHNCSVITITLICFIYFNEVIGEEIVCGNIDIRNSVKNFKKLERCTVVEGYVQIVLIDNGTPKDYENLTFPDLREITDYLLLFRAIGLPSLGKLFPNLSVIRGRILFHDFALVVYEMLQLQQLALKSLTDIVRGAVRIEKNPKLCFVETIDWDRIAKTAKNSHFIHGNKARHECPACGTECPVESARTSDGKIIGDNNGRLCWNSQICQKQFCPSHCETCSPTGECCDPNCLGGCTSHITGRSSCFSCRGFLYNNKCVNKCPKHTYEYLGRRCVTKEECLQISSENLKAIEGKCTKDCPKGYSENPQNKHLCESCKGPCPKVCPTTHVTNIASAQTLKGCTVINGSLEINIQSGGANVIRELEENLQQLEEIRGFLKVARSFPLITLNFLKKLRVIHGEILERNMYSFLVLDNPNLQELWSWDENTTEQTTHLTIKRGKIFFHLNPKLCYNKIDKMQNYVEIVNYSAPWDSHDVSPHSNGDKVACDVSKLRAEIWKLNSEMVGIRFEDFKKQMDDQRSLLGYLIYYRETLYQNVSIFDGRDACSTNVWKVDDFETSGDSDSNDTNLIHIITYLKPYTQYALYVKTYTIASETKGALSDILYFKTQPDTPSQPRSLSARPQTSSEIMIEWEEPTHLNGEVTHYVVTGTRDEDFISKRNYCLEPVTHDTSKKVIPEEESKIDHWKKNSSALNESIKEDSETCCSCKKTSITEDDTEVEKRISFEDYLINSIYIKRSTNESLQRKKREIPDTQPQQSLELSTQSELNTTSQIPTTPPPHVYFKQIFHNSKHLLIPNLININEYTI